MLDKPPINFLALFAANAANHPDKAAIITDEGPVTWLEVEQRSNRHANALRDAGLQRGESVAALLGNCAEGILLFLGAIKAGCIFVPVSAFLAPEQMASIVSDSNAKLFVVAADYQSSAETARAAGLGEASTLRFVSVNFEATGWASLEHMTRKADPVSPPLLAAPSDTACLWYSSGTTGKPKGVMRSLHSLESLGLLSAIDLSINGRSVFYVGTPLSSSGTWIGLLAAMLTGGSVVLPRKFTTSGFLEAMSRQGVSHAGLVPTMLSMILEDPLLDATDLSGLKGVLSVGSKLHASVRADVSRRITPRLWEMYGLTEGFGTVSTPADEVLRPGTVGKATLGSELRIIDSQDREVGPDVEGEIVGFGPLMMTGYYNRPEETESSIWRDERGRTFLRSGDIGLKDEDGFVFILDRKKDMIISGGLNVYPTDLEAVLKRHTDLADMVVIGVPHKKWGEVPVALVQARESSGVSLEAVKDWANAQLARHQQIHEIAFWDRFHRNAFGKLVKHQIRNDYLATMPKP